MSGEPDGLVLRHDFEHRTPDQPRVTPATPSGPGGRALRSGRPEPLYRVAPADDPGTIASTRRLAFAVLGVPEAVEPTAPDPALIERPAALIDDLRGLTESSGLSSAAISAAARRHGLRVSDDQLAATLDGRSFPTPAVTEAIARGCGLDEQQCCAWLAARHRAARAFLPGPHAEAGPRDPRLAALAALDPLTAQTPAQLSILLAELKARRRLSYGQLQLAAKRAGYDVSWSRLWAVGAQYAFPTPRVLAAFLTGCGIAAPEQAPWLEARARLAARRTRVRRTTRPVSAASRSQEPRQCNPPPNPQGARTWAQFCVLLRVLVHWSGRDLTAIAQRAIVDGIPVTREALHYTLAHSTLPGVNTLNAFTTGCGLSCLEQLHWRIVRARLATLAPDSQRLPSVLRARTGGGRQHIDGR